jgi:spore maturation protein SpmA
MKPLMYRHRPAYPALIAAACVLAAGGLIILALENRLKDGIGDPSSIIFTACIACGAAGVLVIIAFARYQYTHLWKKPQYPKPEDVKDSSRGRW